LKTTAENLRKQVADEMRQRTAFEAKRQQNTQALVKGKAGDVVVGGSCCGGKVPVAMSSCC